MNLIERLISLRKHRIAKELLALYGVEIPAQVKIGDNFRVLHRGFGTVIHPATEIKDNVTIYHGVTIGRGDAHVPSHQTKMTSIIIDDHAVLFPGCVVLGGPGTTRVGKRTIVAANAVLTRSTGDNEIWAGIPARRISKRV